MLLGLRYIWSRKKSVVLSDQNGATKRRENDKMWANKKEKG